MTVRKLAVLMVGLAVVLTLGVGPVGWAADSTLDEAAPSLALTIQCEVETLKVGDAIPITFDVVNEGEVPYAYMDPYGMGRSGRPFVFDLKAWDGEGKAVPDPLMKHGGYRGGGAVRDATLAPGATFTKRSSVNL